MRRFLGLVFALSLTMTSAVSADIPLPKNLQYVDPRVCFEGIDKHPDHVFFLRFLTFTGAPSGIPHRMIEVKDAKPFHLKAQRRLLDMNLLAMARKDFEKRSREEPSLKWLTDKTEGVLVAKLATPSTTASASVKEAPVTTYRVSLTGGKLAADMVKPEKSGNATPSGLLPLWAVGILSATAFTWFGVWFSRRQQP